MAGKNNLKPQNLRTKEEQRRIARMGGKASGVSRRRAKTLQEICTQLLNTKTKIPKYLKELDKTEGLLPEGINAEEITNALVMSLAQIKKAREGHLDAFNAVRDTAGQKPTDKQELSGGLRLVWDDTPEDETQPKEEGTKDAMQQREGREEEITAIEVEIIEEFF